MRWLLKLALSYSSTKYEFTYDVYPDSVARGIQQLNSGDTDVLWTGTTVELEEAVRPIGYLFIEDCWATGSL